MSNMATLKIIDAFKKHKSFPHSITYPNPMSTLASYRLYQFIEAQNFLFSPFLGNSQLQLSCWIKDLL